MPAETQGEDSSLRISRFRPLDHIKTDEDLEAYVRARIAHASAASIQAEELRKELDALQRTVFTNTDRQMVMRNRFFVASADSISDENFDFDAMLVVNGDFVNDEKAKYAQMIACTLNYAVAKKAEENAAEQRRTSEQNEQGN